MKQSLTLLLLGLSVFVAPMVGAEIKTVYREMSPAQITRLAETMEVKVTNKKRSDGLPGLTLNYGDYNATLFFYDCVVADQCGSLRFSAAFSMGKIPTQQVINNWNDNGIFARAYLSNSGTPIIFWDYSLRTGATVESVAYTILRFKSVMAAFVEHLQKGE